VHVQVSPTQPVFGGAPSARLMTRVMGHLSVARSVDLSSATRSTSSSPSGTERTFGVGFEARGRPLAARMQAMRSGPSAVADSRWKQGSSPGGAYADLRIMPTPPRSRSSLGVTD
jgi:hypothetical protein